MSKQGFKVFLLVWFCLLLLNACIQPPAKSPSVEFYIGQFIVEKNQIYTTQSDMPTLRSADTYFKIYQTYVKSMPIQDRVNYLMAGVRLLDIDGGELDGFLEVICEDKAVQTAFMQKMEGLIKTLNPEHEEYKTAVFWKNDMTAQCKYIMPNTTQNAQS